MKSSARGTMTVALAMVLLGLPASDTATASPSSSMQVQTSKQPDSPAARLTYTIRYVDGDGKEVHRTSAEGTKGSTVEVVAEDLFAKGYELFDRAAKPVSLVDSHQEVVFTVGKARELMSLTEFLRHPVRYDYPIQFKNRDFTGRQDDLEDFVIKNIYQGNKDTGVFYGTKDQAEDIRKTLLNGSFQGAYARYVVDFRPAPPKHIEGDKYELSIEFVYREWLEEIQKGEAKITEFVNNYGTDYTDAEKAKLIHDWLLKNGKLFEPPHQGQEWFMNSKGIRRVHFPASLMVDGEGVCLTYAMTYGRLAERMGLEIRLIQGYTGLSSLPTQAGHRRAQQAQDMFNNPDSTTYSAEYLNHTWNLVKIDRTWHHIDTFQDKVLNTMNKNTTEPYHYFLRSDAFVREHGIQMLFRKRLRDYTVLRAWNTHRIPTAHAEMNEFSVLRDRSQLDIQP